MPDTRNRYTGRSIDVSFGPVRCRHAVECVRGLPDVFDTARRPWILPDGADPEEVVGVVARCPTGALRTHPARLRGDLHVTGPGGLEARETRAALCSCGGTANAPYCDGGGTCADWPPTG